MKKGKPYRKCSVKSCKITDGNLSYRSFRFPKDDKRAKQWAIACNRQDLVLKTAESLYATNRVCSKHFEDKMYSNDLQNRLLPSAQPTLYLTEDEEENDCATASNSSLKEEMNLLEPYVSIIEEPPVQSVNFDHDYAGTAGTAAVSECLPQTAAPVSLVSNLNYTNVRTNVSSTIGNATTSSHNFGINHNETPKTIILQPIRSVSTSLQSSIVVPSANYGIVANPQITVAAPCNVVRLFSPEKDSKNIQHNKVQLSANQSLDKKSQTTRDIRRRSPKELQLRKENQYLKRENATLRKMIEKMDINIDQFLKCCDEYLSPQTALFVKEQVLIQNKKSRGRRYSLKMKKLCLNLYFKGPRIYRTLSSIFSLPSRATLTRMTTDISFTSGINKDVFDLLSVKIGNIKESEKYCMVCFDEMLLKCHLFYDIKADEIIGFHDNGKERQFKSAKLSCVFVARGIFSNWTQPLAYEFSHTACPSTVLQQLLEQCISKLQNIGLNVVLVVCDMGHNNTKLSNNLGITHQTPYFTLNGQKIFFMYDVPHLLKATRNMFLKYIFTFGQFLAKMEYVRQFYELNQMVQFKLAPKLTSAHINPDPFEKTETRRATQLFSQSVAAGINAYIHFEKIPAEAMGTVIFIDKMDKLFDMLNSTAKYKGEKLHAYVFEGNDFQLAFLQECLKFFDSLQVINYDGHNVTNQMKFIKGWKVTISALLQLWVYLKKKDFLSVQTRRLNQDVVENSFGNICLKEGKCLIPSAIEFVKTFKKLLFHNFFNAGNKHCDDDFDTILLDLHRLNQHELKEVKEINERGIFDDFTLDDLEYQKLDLIEKNSIRYICLYLIQKCLNKHSCQVCEEYTIDHIEFEDSIISCFLKAYQSKNSIFGKLKRPHNNLIFYVCYLEAIFNDHFERVSLEKNIINTLLTKTELITFEHPCRNFPHFYLRKLYFRMRLFYVLKFINRNFKLNNPNKMIIWRLD